MHRGYFGILKMHKLLKPYTDILFSEIFNLSYLWNSVNVMKRYLISLSISPMDSSELKRVHFLFGLISVRSVQLAVLCFENPFHFENPTVWAIISVDTLSFKHLPPQFNLLHLSFAIEMLFFLYRMHFYKRKSLNVVIQTVSSVLDFKLPGNNSEVNLFIDKQSISKVRQSSLKYLTYTKFIITVLGKNEFKYNFVYLKCFVYLQIRLLISQIPTKGTSPHSYALFSFY